MLAVSHSACLIRCRIEKHSSYTSLQASGQLAALGKPWRTRPMTRTRGSWLLVLAACVGCVACSGSVGWAQSTGNRGTAPATPSAGAAAVQKTASEPLRTPSDRPISIDNIRLNLRVDVAKKTVESKATLSFHCVRPTRTVSLDAVDFEVKNVAVTLGEKSIEHCPLHVGWQEADRRSRLATARRRGRNAGGDLSDSRSQERAALLWSEQDQSGRAAAWFGARAKPRPTDTGFRASTNRINGRPPR